MASGRGRGRERGRGRGREREGEQNDGGGRCRGGWRGEGGTLQTPLSVLVLLFRRIAFVQGKLKWRDGGSRLFVERKVGGVSCCSIVHVTSSTFGLGLLGGADDDPHSGCAFTWPW